MPVARSGRSSPIARRYLTTYRREMSVAPLALVGGEEWRGGCEVFDRRLLDLARTATVAVLPTAAAAEGKPEGSVAWARRYFTALGAEVKGVMVVDRDGAHDPAHCDAVRRARFLYIAGGSPPFLYQALEDSPLWQAVIESRRDGLVMAGSSAGAMVLGSSRLGAVAVDVLPHHERRRGTTGEGGPGRAPPEAEPAVERRAPKQNAPAVGIDARTALLWDGAAWSVSGVGDVTMYGLSSLDDLPAPAV